VKSIEPRRAMQSSPDPLDSLLDRWRHATPHPPEHLEQEVWRRVAIAEKQPGHAPGFLALVEAMFARVSFTAAFVAACMLLGLFLAERRVSRQQAQRSVQVVQSYLHLIDPLLDARGDDNVPVVPNP
jgi:hypothetical protein